MGTQGTHQHIHVMTNGEIGGPNSPQMWQGLLQCSLVPKACRTEVYSDSFIVAELCYASKTDCKIIYMGEGRKGSASLQLWTQT